MNNQYKVTSISITLPLIVLAVSFLSSEVNADFNGNSNGSSVPAPSPAEAATSNVTTNGGLTVVTFQTNPGNIRVYLPDDMRAGDTIAGTVVAEPNGQTKEERARNRSALNQYEVMIANSRPGAIDFILKLFRKKTTTANTKTGSTIDFSEPCACPFGFGFGGSGQFVTVEQAASTPAGAAVPATCVEGCPAFLAYGSVLDNASGDATTVEAQYSKALTETQVQQIYQTKETETPASEPKPNEFRLPSVGQQGRRIEIFGPFDGNASNTTLRFGPSGSKMPDFEKGPENVSGGFGLIRPLAESPRKIVFESPTNFTGPAEIAVKEGNTETKGTFRNVGVQLSAPKTNLMRGERTTLTVEVRGLEGIKEDVPLQLDSKGVITMDGGNFQNLLIKPQEVTKDGRYTTTRAITGQQAGGFNVTATVIVRQFDFCLQDDSDPNRLFHFNSFTGDYLFACGGGSCRPGGSTGGTQTEDTAGKPGGTTQPGGTGTPPVVPPTGLSLTGTGRPTMKGCIITLSHNAPDRRIFARLDTCTKTGEANVQTESPKTNVNITDKNVTDNTAASPPPK